MPGPSYPAHAERPSPGQGASGWYPPGQGSDGEAGRAPGPYDRQAPAARPAAGYRDPGFRDAGYAGPGRRETAYGEPAAPGPRGGRERTGAQDAESPVAGPGPATGERGPAVRAGRELHPSHDETVALRMPGRRRPAGEDTNAGDTGDPAPGGRAARRRAAQNSAGRGGRRARGRHSPGAASAASDGPVQAPRTRLEARRAARAAKEPPGVIASRWIGEAFITLGVLMLLFVTYQLWWTNVLAHQEAGGAASTLQDEWAKKQRDPGAFSPGQGFAIIYIPKLDVKAPIAEGIDKHRVLDRGMVGHYGEAPLKTAMPWSKKGNFALAGHRNTHGEPFRYVNRLRPGDEIVVETRRAFYTYKMTSILPQTSPSNTSVIDPVPRGSGFTKPGRYITLTTCTPEFTSTYRLIVWGKLVDERPRSKGKPDALVQ
ncbi:class E sortase [Streptomyces meridianus]